MWIWIAFWTFVAIVSVAGIAAGVLKRKDKLELIRFAIEKGQPLDPALLDKLLPFGEKRNKLTPAQVATGLRFVGLMCFGPGIGLPILGYFISDIEPIVLPALLGTGALLICIGITWFMAAAFVQHKKGSDKSA